MDADRFYIPRYAAQELESWLTRGSDCAPGAYHVVVVEETPWSGVGHKNPIVEDFGWGQLRKDPDDENKWSLDSIAERESLWEKAGTTAERMNQESFDRHFAGVTWTRYLIGHSYVTIDKAEAVRLADVAKVAIDDIGMTQDVEILHAHREFVYWSDDRITRTTGLDLPYGGILTHDACVLISSARGSDSGHVVLEGGIAALARVKAILSSSNVDTDLSRGIYAKEAIQKFEIEWVDDGVRPLFVHSVGYFEGYQWDAYPSLESLKERSAPAPVP